jgi:hypothetical protein
MYSKTFSQDQSKAQDDQYIAEESPLPSPPTLLELEENEKTQEIVQLETTSKKKQIHQPAVFSQLALSLVSPRREGPKTLGTILNPEMSSQDPVLFNQFPVLNTFGKSNTLDRKVVVDRSRFVDSSTQQRNSFNGLSISPSSSNRELENARNHIIALTNQLNANVSSILLDINVEKIKIMSFEKFHQRMCFF